MKIERIPGPLGEDGKRGFLVIAEITFRDRGDDGRNYYDDDELLGRIEDWVDSALNDRDDGPAMRLHSIPAALEPDIKACLDIRAVFEGEN